TTSLDAWISLTSYLLSIRARRPIRDSPGANSFFVMGGFAHLRKYRILGHEAENCVKLTLCSASVPLFHEALNLLLVSFHILPPICHRKWQCNRAPPCHLTKDIRNSKKPIKTKHIEDSGGTNRPDTRITSPLSRLTGSKHNRIFQLCHYFCRSGQLWKDESGRQRRNEMAAG